ncbi:alpha-galactosidase [Bifidobacterium lemurum]|uniref:Alpha-galactosidase n=2 Tax=Bifidobacterium lemurum TaxID=1603886 RepID=A0A261FPA3_9BIFI|nr:glycoside hydrolase family 27 protein [Bifidobacterium lemurum]OZG60974.1 alpha-galactosidase [Bifidobacterium lemurum]
MSGHLKANRPPMGWNSWDSYGTTLNEQELLANARFMAEHLLAAGWDTLVVDIDWYDPTARAHGYNENAPLVLDEYGRQLPDPERFPSAANGAGFKPIADAVHALGLKFGAHMMRGIPRLAVERDLPVKGTAYTARDVADLDHVCKWNPDNYGLNQSHPGAQAWYDAQLDQFAEWGLDFLKVDDMQTPFHSEEIAAYRRAIAKAEAAHGRAISLSLSPGGWVSTGYVDFLRENAQMWRISDDLWDRWEDILQQFARLARWAPFQTAGHWADADMLPLGHIGLRAERGDDRDCRLTPDERRTLLALWCMGRSPLMVGGDLPTSTPETIALLANPALREVTAGSADNHETVRERIFARWDDENSYRGELIVWAADAADWADGTPSAHPNGRYAALFWTGDDDYELGGNIELQSIVGIDGRDDPWTLTDLFAGVADGAAPADVRIEGEGADRVIAGTIPSHGVLWIALDRR